MRRRKRGVILTARGLEKLQNAKTQAENQENQGYRYTREALSNRTGLAVDTLMKVFASDKVDKKTLKDCFKAFDLVLELGDFYRPESDGVGEFLSSNNGEPELPEGQVSLNSNFYIERPPIESDCYKAIFQPGTLIRIKAPRRMGKTSLMARILALAAQQGFHTVFLSLQLADKSLLQNLDKFLQWFCANVTLGLQLPNQLAHYWENLSLYGSKISCKIYFEEYLLTNTNQPIVLGLDDVDRLFQYSDLADDFFGLLRAWHEEAKNREIWQKLRLIVVHSTEVYIPLNINQSPFNVGLPIELPAFTLEQVLNLAHRHNLDWSMQQVEKLFSFIGGNPYLIRLALYHIWNEDLTLEDLLTTSLDSDENIYRDHLTRQLWNVQQQHSALAEALAKVVTSSQPVELDLIQAFQLQSLGLVRFQSKDNTVSSSCKLYTQYFRAYFARK